MNKLGHLMAFFALLNTSGCNRHESELSEPLRFRSIPWLAPNGQVQGVVEHSGNPHFIKGVLGPKGFDSSVTRELPDKTYNAVEVRNGWLLAFTNEEAKNERVMIAIDASGNVRSEFSLGTGRCVEPMLLPNSDAIIVYSHNLELYDDRFDHYKFDPDDAENPIRLLGSFKPNFANGSWHLHASQVSSCKTNSWFGAVTADGYPSIWKVSSEKVEAVDSAGLDGFAPVHETSLCVFDVAPDLGNVAICKLLLPDQFGKSRAEIIVWNLRTKEMLLRDSITCGGDNLYPLVSFVGDNKLLVLCGDSKLEVDVKDDRTVVAKHERRSGERAVVADLVKVSSEIRSIQWTGEPNCFQFGEF